jgi:Grx4 family monothiol glutaredoxin
VRLLRPRHAGPQGLRRDRNHQTVNVLEDEEIRQGIKEYANWPTIPQLYVDGEFVGGSDIMMEMYQSGELQQMLKAEHGKASGMTAPG